MSVSREFIQSGSELQPGRNALDLPFAQGVEMTQVLSEHLLELARQARSAAPPGEEEEFAFEAVYAELQIIEQIRIGLDSPNLPLNGQNESDSK